VYSLVISTIGCPFLFDSLATLRYPPDDIIVVLDLVGRKSSTLDQDYPLPQLERDLRERYPAVRLLYNNPSGPWAVMNQCYNIGWRNARHPYVWFTHDDIEYPDYDFPSALRPVLEAIEADRDILGKRIVGLVLPEHEILNEVNVPDYPVGTWGIAQCISPVSQVVSVEAMREMGGFDEVDGVWYDGQLQAETHIRDWWYVLLPTPLIRHMSNRTYRVNNWGAHWKANPVWGNYTKNFEKRYGEPWRRSIVSLLPMQPIDDPRYGVALAP
jgi:hypothetical protein